MKPGKKRITAGKIKSLIASNRVVDIRPRKRVVTVDGSNYFTITKTELDKLSKPKSRRKRRGLYL